jgi:hypothetical protein
MSGKMNWDKARYANRPTEAAIVPDDKGLVTIRCRKCGHIGEVRRWQAENKRMRCSKCQWRSAR